MATAHLSSFLRQLTRGAAAEALAERSDRHLVERCLSRWDEAVFVALLRRHGPMVYRVCWRVLTQPQDAEDAFQATFLLLIQRLHTLRKHDSLASWLHGVAHRVALKARAQAARRRRHERRVTVARVAPPEDAAWAELRAVLDRELARLPERWRLPLILCYLEGRTQDEAASQLGWSRTTFQRRLAEAQSALGRRLTRRGVVWPAALSAVLLSDCVTPAALPPGLVGATVEAAASVAAGRAATAVVSAHVVALMKAGAGAAAVWTKFKLVTAVVVGVSVIGVGAGALPVPEPHPMHPHLLGEAAVPQKGEDNAALAVLDKAIKAVGGEAKLKSATAVFWKAQGKNFNDGNESAFTNESTVQGIGKLRMEWHEQVDGNVVFGVTVLNGEKGWRKVGDDLQELTGDALTNHKRNLYLLVVPVTLAPLKGKEFRIESAGEDKIGDKLAAVLKVTGPDGKDFHLSFDQASGLLVRMAIQVRFQGRDVTQETTFGDYKDFDGIKKATQIERKRDREKILEQEILEFKVLDKVPAETFAEPR
jgi:RNA polymerase sigma factor (sigma-70 family)